MARQVGKFSGCSIQILWQMSALSNSIESVQSVASSGACIENENQIIVTCKPNKIVIAEM